MFRRRHTDVFPPRVEVIHWRDPDNSCEHVVFIDGVEVPADVYTIDPGHGYTRIEWDMDTEAQVSSASPLVAEVLRNARDDVADGPYINEEN